MIFENPTIIKADVVPEHVDYFLRGKRYGMIDDNWVPIPHRMQDNTKQIINLGTKGKEAGGMKFTYEKENNVNPEFKRQKFNLFTQGTVHGCKPKYKTDSMFVQGGVNRNINDVETRQNIRNQEIDFARREKTPKDTAKFSFKSRRLGMTPYEKYADFQKLYRNAMQMIRRDLVVNHQNDLVHRGMPRNEKVVMPTSVNQSIRNIMMLENPDAHSHIIPGAQSNIIDPAVVGDKIDEQIIHNPTNKSNMFQNILASKKHVEAKAKNNFGQTLVPKQSVKMTQRNYRGGDNTYLMHRLAQEKTHNDRLTFNEKRTMNNQSQSPMFSIMSR